MALWDFSRRGWYRHPFHSFGQHAIIATISLPAMVKPITTTIAEKSSFNAPLRCSRRCDASVPMMQQRHREDRSTAADQPQRERDQYSRYKREQFLEQCSIH
ncbi:MAG: hypothetical protein ACJAVZ_003051 [Afipia broomeae]|jgi:hypothetical protein|uniref:hypothetical protein n=1 Tax=Parasphingorhabdus sp. TaxID=2709688 RepID=UPI003001C92D|tara:strand:- start:179628 stop:179933 length:306 start_codon:yes stop_codon:yes gene_type:complete